MSQIQDTPDGVSPWQIASSFQSTATTSGAGPEKETFGDDENGGHFRCVAFPNRKSIIFDNKLDFSGIKLAES